MESDNLKTIAAKLKNKIQEIEDCYNSINESAKNLDGTSDNWVGNEQRVFWNKYTEMYRKYPKNIEKFNEFYDFLVKTINEYDERESSINTAIDNNADNLDV